MTIACNRAALFGVILAAATQTLDAQAAPAPQTDADHYTRYELLAPGSAKFKIIYEVTATTSGATIRGSPKKFFSEPCKPAVTLFPLNQAPLHRIIDISIYLSEYR